METDVLYIQNRSRLLPSFADMKNIAREDVWADVKGYEGLYQISSRGIIKSLSRKTSNNHFIEERIRVLRDKGGYASALLSIDNKSKEHSAHRLVATAFLIKPEGKTHVNHIDGNKSNNCWWNLEWVTAKENSAHAVSNDLVPRRKKRMRYQRRHPAPRLTNENEKLVKENLSLCIKELASRFGAKTSMIRSVARQLSEKDMYP
jgi:hypothetical protein